MIAGIGGGLVSEYFAEHLLDQVGDARLDAGERSKLQAALARLRRSAANLGPASSTRAVFDVGAAPLAEFLGFRIRAADPIAWGPRQSVHLASRALDPTTSCAIVCALHAGTGSIRMIVVPWGEDLGASWRPALVSTIDAEARWCLLFNGCHLRVLDADRPYSREHLDFDLDVVCSDPASFAAFYTLVRARSFTAAGGREALIGRAIELSSRHSAGVCRSLKDGVVEAIGALAQGFVDARRAERIEALFEQSLTLVYRLLFLLFAEARRMLPNWHPVFSAAYSVETLRAVAEDPNPNARIGLWDTFQAISRLAHHGCHAGTLVVTPFNGRLFSPAKTPLGEHGRVSDSAAERAVVALSTTAATKAGVPRARIAYRDLGVEQLGAVYETILDYKPSLETSTGHRSIVHLTAGSGRRKATGTFYTPRSITQFLVRRVLHPLTVEAAPDEILRLKIVDPAMGSGAFLVAACNYLAAAYERSLVAQGACHVSDIDERDRAAFRRTIAQRCLYGVDANPIAVQLARLSLWLATLAADKPLTFLDHHLASGDSLVGASPFDVMRAPPKRSSRPRRSDPHPMLFALDEFSHDLERVLPDRFRISDEPGDSLEAVQTKERLIDTLARSDGPFNRWKHAGDAWCACWFGDDRQRPARGVYQEMVSAILEGSDTSRYPWLEALVTAARRIGATRHFFHWSLEFPEVFFTAAGERLDNPGFDAVVGNPPWDMLRADSGPAGDQEYDRNLFDFARTSGVYVEQSDGHPNRFQLFVERAFQLARRGGRIGLVVPWGLFADHGCAALRRRLFLGASTDTIVSFDNSNAIFPIHRSLRFALVAATSGQATGDIRCRFGENATSVLDTLPDAATHDAFPLSLSPALLRRVSGDDYAVPDVRTTTDLVILDRVSSRWPWFSAPNGWRARFGRELNATDDKPQFLDTQTQGREHQDAQSLARAGWTALSGDDGHLPVVEGKHIRPFAVHLDAARYWIPAPAARKLLGGDTSFRRWRLAYRDVASATNRLTLIAAMLPPDCVSTHTLFCLKTPLDEQARWFLCAVMNSYVANYLVRLRVTTHVSAGIVERLPVPFVSTAAGLGFEIGQLARQVTNDGEGEVLDRLQADVARLYGVTVEEFAHVLETFPLIERERREAALTWFERSAVRAEK